MSYTQHMCFFKRNCSCFTEGVSTCLHPVRRTRRLLIVCRQRCTGSGVLITRTDKGFLSSTEYHKWVQRTSVSFGFFNRHIRSNGDLHCAVQPLSELSIYSLEADITTGTAPLRFTVVWNRNSVFIKTCLQESCSSKGLLKARSRDSFLFFMFQ